MAIRDEQASLSGVLRARRSGNLANLIEDVAVAPEDACLLCIVIDLGDLQRSNRVPRLLGPGYTDSLIDAAEARIHDIVGAPVRLHHVDSGCFAFVLADDGTSSWEGLLDRLIQALRLPFDCAG